MVRKVNRNIIYYWNGFQEFYFKFDLKTQDSIDHVLDLVRHLEIIPGKYMKLIRGTQGIYEIRVYSLNRSIRLMSFFNSNDQVIILNCFIKKSQKVPQKEIWLAEKLKKKYSNEKI